MLTIKFDNALSLTQATEKREETAYLRGTVVIASEGFEGLLHSRINVFADTNPVVLDLEGKWAEVDASLTGRTVTEDGKQTFTLNDLSVIAYLGDKAAKALRVELSKAQLTQLMAAQPRKIPSRTAAAAAAGVAPSQEAPVAVADGI